MTAKLGMNVAPDADPAALAHAGVQWVRLVERDTIDYTNWLTALGLRGIEVWFVFDSSPESLGNNEGQWKDRMTRARDRWGHVVKIWQPGNEPDGSGIASWTMDQSRVNRLLVAAREVFPRNQFTLVAPGLVSGQPSWLSGGNGHPPVRIDLVDVLSAHLYAKGVASPGDEAATRFTTDGYRAFGLPLAIDEYDSRARGLTAWFRDYPGIAYAAPMAWDDGMTESTENIRLGLLQNAGSMADFVAATGGPLALPTPTPPPPPAPEPPASTQARYQLGFEQFHNAAPDLLGDPLEDERGGVPGFSQQRTTNGILTAANLAGRGWTLLFWERDTGTRYLFERGVLEAIA